MTSSTNILVIEDNPGDVRLIREYLRESITNTYEIWEGRSLSEGKVILREESIDLVLLDLYLPDSQGLDTFEDILKEFPLYPYIVLTGLIDENIGLLAVEKGAQDYLNKGELNSTLLTRAIKYSIGRHQNELEQRKIKKRLERAQELAKVGDWEINPQTNSLSCSNQLYKIFEIDPVYGFNTLEAYIMAIYEADQTKVAEEIHRAYAEQSSFFAEHRILLKDRSFKYILLMGHAVVQNDSLASIVGTVQDITEQKRMEQLQRDKDLAEKAFKVRQEFLAKTSHEIRTPLNPILGLTDILLNNTAPTAQQKEYLEAIKTAGDTLLAVVNDILDLSKIEAGKIVFNRECFRLKELFSSIREMMEINLKEKWLKADKDGFLTSYIPVKLITRIDPQIPDFLFGDSVRLSQILLNLVGNAIKFTDEGEIIIEAKCVQKDNQQVQIELSVSDTGIGIPEDKLYMIFESFKQVDSGMNRKYGGVGLGLTIVKQLVKLQGGDINVKSQLDVGSTFSFKLSFEYDEVGVAFQEEPTIDNKQLSGMRVLVVEDNETNQIVTQNILASWGIESDVANNGRECIERLLENSYDLVLMDIQMPEMDGYQATEFIRKQLQPPKRDVAIIALTANAFSGIDDKCLQIGMNDYISKPVKNDSLFIKISQFANHTAKPVNGNHYVDAPTLASNEQIITSKESSNGHGERSHVEGVNMNKTINTPPYTDLTYLQDTLKDSFIIKKTVAKFIETTPKLLNQLDDSLIKKDYTALSKYAHKLKSSIDTMGIKALKPVIRSIEQKSKNYVYLEVLPGEVKLTRQLIELSFDELKEKVKDL